MKNPAYIDQLKRSICLPEIPRRIISLVPSQTELLYHLGLDETVVGITKFCIHPEKWFRSKTRVGGTKTIDTEKVKQLQPDLIIANKEENVKEQIEILESIAPVWVSDVNDLDDALEMIAAIGKMVGKLNESAELISSITDGFAKLSAQISQLPHQLITAYLIWKDPYMTVGGDTFISNMLKRCGFKNVFADRNRYPEITLEELTAPGCDLVLLSSEPYPFKEKHLEEIQNTIPGAKTLLVDGEMFSWYGSRLQYAATYFEDLIARLQVS